MSDIETLVDVLADLLDGGLSVAKATNKTVETEDEVDTDLLYERFAEVYLCTPEEYAQNVKDDASWAKENSSLLDTEFDDLSVL